MTQRKWLTIETAPRDGTPVFVRMDNFGKPENGDVRCWAWHNGSGWVEITAAPHRPFYLGSVTHWLPAK